MPNFRIRKVDEKLNCSWLCVVLSCLACAEEFVVVSHSGWRKTYVDKTFTVLLRHFLSTVEEKAIYLKTAYPQLKVLSLASYISENTGDKLILLLFNKHC